MKLLFHIEELWLGKQDKVYVLAVHSDIHKIVACHKDDVLGNFPMIGCDEVRQATAFLWGSKAEPQGYRDLKVVSSILVHSSFWVRGAELSL